MTFVTGAEMSQWWSPMANAVIFGLGFSTMLTLIVVPVLYSFTGGGLNDDKQEEQEKKKGSRWERLIYWLKGHLKLPAMLQFGKNRDLRKLLDKEE